MIQSHPFIGFWRIIRADIWTADYLDMVEPAHLRLGARDGHIAFGCVTGDLDCRLTERHGAPTLEFSWEGFDEDMQLSGRGNGTIDDDGRLRVQLFIHHGDEASLLAEAVQSRPVAPQAKPMKRRPLRGSGRRGKGKR